MPPTGGRWAAAFPWNAVLCGRRLAVPAITPIAGHGGEGNRQDLGQDDPEAVGVLDPHFGQPPGLRHRLPQDRDSGRGQRACSAWTSRTWIQIITEDPGGPAACPETSSSPLAGVEHHPRDRPAGRTRGRCPGRAGHGRSGGCGPGCWGAAGSGCSERPRHYSSITLSDPEGLTRTHTVPPICTLRAVR
jgi:hypothetical protein